MTLLPLAGMLSPLGLSRPSAAISLDDYVSALNPLLFYKMNEVSGSTAINYGSVGSAANATYTGGFTLNQAGLIGPSVWFNGTTGWLSIPFISGWANSTSFEWVIILKQITSEAATSRLLGRNGSYTAFSVNKLIGGASSVSMLNTAATGFPNNAKWAFPTAVWTTHGFAYDDTWSPRAPKIYTYGKEIDSVPLAMTGTYQTPTNGMSVMANHVGAAATEGYVNRILLFAGQLTTLQRQTITTLAGLTVGVPITHSVIPVGDSITNGNAGPENPYPNQLIGLLPNHYGVYHFGTNSSTVLDRITAAPTQEDTRYDAAMTQNIIVMGAGFNDLITNGQSVATVQANYTQYCNDRKAAHPTVKIVCNTITPTLVSNPNMAALLAFNAWLRTDHLSFADGLADIAGDPRMDDATDATYYRGDFIHPTSAGYAVIAELVEGAVLAL